MSVRSLAILVLVTGLLLPPLAAAEERGEAIGACGPGTASCGSVGSSDEGSCETEGYEDDHVLFSVGTGSSAASGMVEVFCAKRTNYHTEQVNVVARVEGVGWIVVVWRDFDTDRAGGCSVVTVTSTGFVDQRGCPAALTPPKAESLVDVFLLLG